jgi:hypothetical protein
MNYVSSKIKVEIVCKTHGPFFQLIDNHINKKTGCPKCKGEFLAKKFKPTNLEFIKKADLVHNNEYDYSLVEYINAKTEINILCRIHGRFKQKPNYHLCGEGCPKCSKNRPLSKELFLELANKKHKNKYCYDNINYKNCFRKISIKCPKHGCFEQQPYKHLSGNGCPLCCNSISKPEIEFLDYLSINPSDRQVRISKYKIDGIKENKAFEFLGDYWHGNPKFYKKDDFNKVSKKTFGSLYNKTINKFDYLKGVGFTIYYMWESDWLSWCKDKTKIFPIKKF